VVEVGAVKGRDEGTCAWRFAESGQGPLVIAPGLSFGWILPPHRYKQFVVDVPVTSSARPKSDVPAIGGPLPLLGSLALGAQPTKLGADIRTSSSLGTLSI
jgi:hypothetical protein